MYKIRQYFSTLEITRGFFIALSSAAFIYLNHWGYSFPILNTFLALLSLYFLLQSNTKTWFFSGAFIGLFWFWWIALSLIHYEMVWAVPIEIFIIMLSYSFLFALISWISEKLSKLFTSYYCPVKKCPWSTLFTLILKAIGLLGLSYIHPFSFDWFKPELMFVESYLGIEKWQFTLILIAMILSIWRQQFLYLLLILFAYQMTVNTPTSITNNIAIVTTKTSVKEKWDETLHDEQFKAIFKQIDNAIDANKTLVILPESVLPVYVNRSQELINTLQEKAKQISIVIGGLYWDGKTPRNSSYIFTNEKITVANKVLLVPFGEANPLPDFLSDWVNEVFYDGAVDYKASANIIDYSINGITYRNAICFEATSEKLYEKDKHGERPKNMIVLSNNGWFTPSIEPTLQKLLLQYYSKKYGTTIYHSVNMSESYVIQNGNVIE